MMVNRYFQHLEKGKLMGKRTRLLYIDDITEDDMILYYFEDGTKCNKDFVGQTRETEPIKNNRVMIELASATAMWRFERKEVHPEVSGFMVASDGVRYEAPDPNVKFKGGPGSQQTEVEQDAKNGIRIDVIPPAIPQNYVQPTDDDWLLSLHPELETTALANLANTNNQDDNRTVAYGAIKSINPINTTNEAPQTVQQNNVVNVQPTPQNTVVNSAITTSVTETVRSACLNINVDGIVSPNSEYKEVCLIIDGQKIVIDTNEFKNRLARSTAEVNKSIERAMNTIQSVSSEIIEKEDVLIKNMIDKCKHERCKITLGMSLDLPPKEVYETIKSVYADGMCEEFVRSVVARLEQEMLIQSLTSGLTAFYEKKISSKVTENAVQ